MGALAKLLAILNSEKEPRQVSLGFAFSMIVGFTPLYSLHNLLVVLLVLVLRVNLSAFLLGFALFSALAFALDPLFHALGLAVLTAPSLEGLFTSLYNNTLMRLEAFNNSIVMGSLIVSIVAFVPMVWLGNVLIERYREHVLAWLRQTKLAGVIRASKFWSLYERVSGVGGLP